MYPIPSIFSYTPLTDGRVITAGGGSRIGPITANAPDHNHIIDRHNLGFFRMVHTIHISAIWCIYSSVGAATAQQRFSVIYVINSNGYGHGSVQMVTFLMDMCGTDDFVVATLGEDITLRISLNDLFSATMLKSAAGGEGEGCIRGRGR